MGFATKRPWIDVKVRIASVCAVCLVALAGCMDRLLGKDQDDYRTMSCDELMEHLAAFDEKIKRAIAELEERGHSAERQQAMRRRLREESQDLAREISRRCPVMVEPRIL